MTLKQRQPQRYGYIPDLPDHRDLVFRPRNRAVPTKLDLRDTGFLNFPIYDQGNLGSCTANAIAAAIRFAELKEQKEAPDAQGPLPNGPSRLAIYWWERWIEGSVQTDSGAMIRDGLKAVATDGFYDEKHWPYDISRFTQTPPPATAVDVIQKAAKYKRVGQSWKSLRSALASGFPVVVGFTVYSSFGADTPMPGKNDRVEGGHAVLLVAYDDATRRFTCRNSWGAGWGHSGYFTIPYGYLGSSALAGDYWLIQTEA